MDCNETRALLGADVDHELSAADAWRIARHVGGCGACRLERERLVALRRAMRQAEYHRAPGALRARIAAGLPLAAAPFAQAPVQDLPASDVPVSDMPVSDMPVSDAPEQDTPSQDMRAPNKPAVDRPPEAKPRFGADARGGARAGRWFARPGSRGPTLDRPGPGPGPRPPARPSARRPSPGRAAPRRGARLPLPAACDRRLRVAVGRGRGEALRDRVAGLCARSLGGGRHDVVGGNRRGAVRTRGVQDGARCARGRAANRVTAFWRCDPVPGRRCPRGCRAGVAGRTPAGLPKLLKTRPNHAAKPV